MTLARDLANLARTTTTTAELNKLDGFTGTTAELNKLSGFTGVAADLNYAKDLKATGVTTTEFDHLDGVANSLAVTDRTSNFTRDSYWTASPHLTAYSFNGFMFFNFYVYKSGSGPSHGQLVFTIDAGYRPNKEYAIPTIGHQADTAEMIKFKTNGEVTVENPYNAVGNSYYVVTNGWYKIA